MFRGQVWYNDYLLHSTEIITINIIVLFTRDLLQDLWYKF